MFSNEIKFQNEISDSDITFESVIDDCSEDPEFKKQLSNSNVLIIPYEKDSKNNNIFPVGTTEIYRYLQQKSPNQVKLDIATKDDNYVELAQHSDLVNLPTIIVTYAILPILTSLISNYIYDRLKPDNSVIKSEIIITDEKGNNKLIKFNGPAKEYVEMLSKIFK